MNKKKTLHNEKAVVPLGQQLLFFFGKMTYENVITVSTKNTIPKLDSHGWRPHLTQFLFQANFPTVQSARVHT